MITEIDTEISGFMWIVYDDTLAVELVKEQQEEKQKVRRMITNDELKYGFITKLNTEYELIIPVFRINIKVNEEYITDDDKYTLSAKDGDYIYNKTLIIGEDKKTFDELFESGKKEEDEEGHETEEDLQDDIMLKELREIGFNTKDIENEDTEDNDEDKKTDNESIYLDFIGTPTDLKYNLEIDPGKDKDGKKPDKYFAFNDEPYILKNKK